MSDKKVRVRFAPSPTGPLHMGGVRTALYNYLFAKKHQGDFILRIEDTDQTRYVKGAEEYIIESLKWCGLVPNESPENPGGFGPYRQSERKNIYRQYADVLVEKGHAYYAFDTPEDLDSVREKAKAAKMPNWQYNSITRNSMKNSLTLPAEEVDAKLRNGEPYTIRLKVPRNEEVRFEDIIRGWVVVNSSNIDDKVIYKSDGMPTYHLANIVDDHLMQISHVIRGEEWLPSAPMHVLLYRYLGWEDEMPKFAHLPLILKPDGNGKLSKRDGDRLGFPVFPLEWQDPDSGEVSSGYREKGYFPEAFINILAFLGWNPGTEKELYSVEELVQDFSLERVGKAGAKFDFDKAKWYNQQYLRTKSDSELVRQLAPLLKSKGIEETEEKIEKACALLKERATFVADMMEGLYLFVPPAEYDEKVVGKKWKEGTPELMLSLKDVLSQVEPFKAATIESAFKTFLEKNQLGMGQVLPNLRVLLTGQGMGPSVFEIAELLGKPEVVNRIEKGIERIGNG